MFHWATSDQHYSHANIIKLCHRPFANRHHMRDELVERHNSLVRTDDNVLHIGDFLCKATTEYAAETLLMLNGRHTLVLGNHDKSATKMREIGFEAVYEQLLWTQGGKRYLAVHNPAEAMPIKDCILLHGHLHGRKYTGNWEQTIDVGVDCHKYFPLRLR